MSEKDPPLLEQDVGIFPQHRGPVAGHHALGAKTVLDGTCHELHQSSAGLRRLLAETDTLYLKLMALQLLARDLHLYAQVLDISPEILEPLTAAERSLQRALESEFRAAAHLLGEDVTGPVRPLTHGRGLHSG